MADTVTAMQLNRVRPANHISNLIDFDFDKALHRLQMAELFDELDAETK